MISFSFSDHQRALIERPIESKIFLEGPAGAGKTTAGVGRLLHLLDSRVRARAILGLAPQRALATPYYPVVPVSALPVSAAIAIITDEKAVHRILVNGSVLVSHRIFANPSYVNQVFHPIHRNVLPNLIMQLSDTTFTNPISTTYWRHQVISCSFLSFLTSIEP